jgi:hypothetical protein
MRWRGQHKRAAGMYVVWKKHRRRSVGVQASAGVMPLDATPRYSHYAYVMENVREHRRPRTRILIYLGAIREEEREVLAARCAFWDRCLPQLTECWRVHTLSEKTRSQMAVKLDAMVSMPTSEEMRAWRERGDRRLEEAMAALRHANGAQEPGG